ncbi:MAG: hypothetical protein QF404_06685 [Planctomycetota bacterium]|jgi:hypothetical protein|nr:hypothetical protein [Planctomycetota bacterium]
MLISKETVCSYIVDTPAGPEELKFWFPGALEPEFQAGKKKFLDSRIVQKGRRMVNRSLDARIQFFDRWCRKVQLLEEIDADGQRVNIMDGPDWKSKVDVVIKAAVVSQNFEEKESLTAEDMEDLPSASDEE